MSKYIITVEEVLDKGEKYSNKETLYEQTVEGDSSIVSAVVQRVLDYTDQRNAKTKAIDSHDK